MTNRPNLNPAAIDDPLVAAALRYIRREAHRGINVEDVLNHLAMDSAIGAVSRSTLDRRFAERIGRSAKDEILRVRLKQIKQLLIETDRSIFEIATQMGVEHAENLQILFKKMTGETPGEYRKRMRG